MGRELHNGCAAVLPHDGHEVATAGSCRGTWYVCDCNGFGGGGGGGDKKEEEMVSAVCIRSPSVAVFIITRNVLCKHKWRASWPSYSLASSLFSLST